MDEKVLNYRKKHPKCKYCKWLKFICTKTIPCNDYYICKAKDKIIRKYFPDMTEIPRWFCECYEVDETRLDEK